MVAWKGKLFLVFTFLLLALSLVIAENDVSNGVNNAPRVHVWDGTSTNWAGYAVLTDLNNPQIGSVSDVKGSWIVPSVDCSNANTYSSFWIGIDGYSSKTVEQIGTESDCSNGNARYYAWYEFYPKFPSTIKMKISPGDLINAEVEYIGNNNFQLTITDITSGASFTTTKKANKADRSSAEWIAEAPLSSRGVLPLANFGTVNFLDAEATLNEHTGTISDASWQNDPINMQNSSGITKAVPSSLSSDGSGFSVSWQNS